MSEELKKNEQTEEQYSLNDDRRVKVLSPGALVVKRFFRNRLAVLGLIMLIVMFVFSFVGGFIMPYGQAEQFYTVTYLDKEYAVADGQEFSTILQAQFLLALGKGQTEYSYKGEDYKLTEEGADFYSISKADGTVLAIAYKDIVNAADGMEDPAFAVKYEALKAYANEQGVRIIGDIPIYVALDSADAWAEPELFQFDEDGMPVAVAGCPPDGFSATGQLWGNPLYDWAYHKETGYAWWIRRVASCYKMYDMIRIDHFRGFDEYYAIPAEDQTAEFGKWRKGPGLELFTVLKEKLGDLNIIVEDLGYITDTVREMVRACGFPNMKVLEFAFDARDSTGPKDYLPYNYDKNCVVYTGTHDNETLRGWLSSIPKADYSQIEKYLGRKVKDKDEMALEVIRLAQASAANLCIIPLQDYLLLDNKARINEPSTLGKNWKWRLQPGQLSSQTGSLMKKMAKTYGRLPEEPAEKERKVSGDADKKGKAGK